jgi:hypothetical protein
LFREIIVKRFFAVIPIILFILLGACGAAGNVVSPDVGTFVAQTQTATMWTPTPTVPSPTSVPKEAVIVDALNGVLRGGDPLEEAIDAKFYITDIGFDTSGNPPIIITMRVHVECEWVLKPTCTTERAFVVLMHALEREGVRKKIIEQIPITIEFVQVTALDHMSQIGIIEIRWQDVLAFTNGEITGDQLAARVNRFNP